MVFFLTVSTVRGGPPSVDTSPFGDKDQARQEYDEAVEEACDGFDATTVQLTSFDPASREFKVLESHETYGA